LFAIDNFPEELFQRSNASLLGGCLRGVERESLRVDRDGRLSTKTHPMALGSSLTHPQITTDFSEALIELITSPCHRTEELFAQLRNTHAFVVANLDDELLWSASMPCYLGSDNEIPVARYGSSNSALMKTLYRVGLGHRYGRKMQCVAGLHYNFSFPDAFWAHFYCKENVLQGFDDYKNARYFSLIRNFRRHYWLLILLFGASPTMCASFVKDRPHSLEQLPGGDLYLPWSTSLRMGNLGYQSSAQESLYVCYNTLPSYIGTLCRAIRQPYAPYERIGLKDGNGEYQQLSTGLLQIENEFYSSIRPKRSSQSGETALTALATRGVEYIEVRCLDINPFHALGISEEQVRLLDVFLLYCALADSPSSSTEEFKLTLANHKSVVHEGRKPGLKLRHAQAGELDIGEWANAVLSAMEPCALALDSAYENSLYSAALTAAKAQVAASDQLLSTRVLNAVRSRGSFADFVLQTSREHCASLKAYSLPSEVANRYRDLSEESLQQQHEMEQASGQSFDSFLRDYFQQYDFLAQKDSEDALCG